MTQIAQNFTATNKSSSMEDSVNETKVRCSSGRPNRSAILKKWKDEAAETASRDGRLIKYHIISLPHYPEFARSRTDMNPFNSVG